MIPHVRLPYEEILIDTSWLLMLWDSNHQCVLAEWRAFATHAEFQGALMTAIEAGASRRSHRLVHDTRKLESVNEEDRRWLRQTWAPLAIASGLKRVAVVVAAHGLARYAIDEMEKQHEGSILDWRIFATMREALDWVTDERTGVAG